MKHKLCAICGVEFLANTNGVYCSDHCRNEERLARQDRRKRDPVEKERIRRWASDWAKRNSEKVTAAQVKYREQHREELRLRYRAYDAEHRDDRRKKSREFYKNNTAKERARVKSYYESNRSKEIIRGIRYKEENRDRVRIRESVRCKRETAAIAAVNALGIDLSGVDQSLLQWHVRRRAAYQALKSLGINLEEINK
jgi:hypothetical protein